MAEWLRRLTRNQMGSSRVGSNPTRSGLLYHFRYLKRCIRYKLEDTILMTGIGRNLGQNTWSYETASMALSKSTLGVPASRDSSVGRASDWRSEGPWFNPGSRHKLYASNVLLRLLRYTTWRLNKTLCNLPSEITKTCCDGRVVKAFDLKSNGIFPRRFESYSQRSSLWDVLTGKPRGCRPKSRHIHLVNVVRLQWPSG